MCTVMTKGSEGKMFAKEPSVDPRPEGLLPEGDAMETVAGS